MSQVTNVIIGLDPVSHLSRMDCVMYMHIKCLLKWFIKSVLDEMLIWIGPL